MKSFRYLTLLVVILSGILLPIDSQAVVDRVLPENPADSLRLTKVRLENARAQEDYPAVTEYLIDGCEYQLLLTEDSLPALIGHIDSQARSCPDTAAQSLLYAYEASLLHRYYESHRRDIQQRGTLAEPPADMREWNTENFAAAIIKLSEQSLQAEEQLFATPLSRFPFLMQSDSLGCPQVSTLYDFLAGQTIDLYKTLIVRYPTPWVVEEWPLRIDTTILSSPEGSLSHNLRRRIIGLYERRYALHCDTPQSPIAFLARLDRERFLQEQAPDSAYTGRLLALYREYETLPFSTEALISAGEVMTAQEPLLATWLSACEKQMKRYADYPRIGCLRNLYLSITAPLFYATVPEVVYPDKVTDFTFTYSRADSLTLHIFPGQDSTPLLSRDLTVAGTRIGETREHEESIPALAPGRYRIAFDVKGTAATTTEARFSVSRFFAYTQNRTGNGSANIVVTDGASGAPQSNCEVRLYTASPRYSDHYVYLKSLFTDHNGILTLDDREIVAFRPVTAQDTLYPITRITVGDNISRQPLGNEINTALFTDRSIYRPGDTLHFAGIVFSRETTGSRALAGESQTVELYGVNGKIAECLVESDAYGSFAGQFVLPKQISGYLRLQGYNGTQSVQVAEYKKGTFDITLDTPASTYFSGHPIKLSGRVTGYAGEAIAHAPVWFQIKESSYYRGNRAVQNLSGMMVTDAEGKFLLPFEPQPSDPRASFCMYQAEFSATAANGETQSVQFWFGVTDKPLQIEMELPERHDKQTPLSLSATVTAAPNAAPITRRSYEVFALELPRDSAGDSRFLTENRYDTLRNGLRVDAGEIKGDGACRLKTRKWASGVYRVVVSAVNQEGCTDSLTRHVIIYGDNDKRPPLPTALWVPRREITVHEGETMRIACGSCCPDVSLLCQLFEQGEMKSCFRTPIDNENIELEIPYAVSADSPATLVLSLVKENRLYTSEVIVRKACPDHTLKIIPRTFRDRLTSGSREEWTFRVKDSRGKTVQARLIATLYDQALDAITPHSWYFSPFITPIPTPVYVQSPGHLYLSAQVTPDEECPARETWNSGWLSGRYSPMLLSNGLAKPGLRADATLLFSTKAESGVSTDKSGATQPVLRRDFRETAFFAPRLQSNKRGIVDLSFTLPDSHTSWKLILLAVTEDMNNGLFTDTVVASKPLMVFPNLPRFARTGDRVSIATRISNTSRQAYKGNLSMELFNPENDSLLYRSEAPFETAPGQTQSLPMAFSTEAWNDMPCVGVRLVATADDGTSDGEQRLLPLLPRRIFLTETASPEKHGNEGYAIEMQSLITPPAGESLFDVTLSYAPSPLWFVVQALPGLTEQPDVQSTPDLLAAFYGNTLAEALVMQNPSFASAIATQSRSADTLTSPLSQNESLKMILLEETPWLLEARNENERMTRLIRLLDPKHCTEAQRQSLEQLLALQNDDGGFPWRKGMESHIGQTLSVMECYINLYRQNLLHENESHVQLYSRAMSYLSRNIAGDTTRIREQEQISLQQLRYLTILAAFPQSLTEAEKKGQAMLYEKATREWRQMDLAGKALTAQLLYDSGRKEEAQRIVASLIGYATTHNESTGWANNKSSRNAPISDIEQHTLLMNTVARIRPDEKLLTGMATWLLQQKETRDWGSTPATLNAISALVTHCGLSLAPTEGSATIVWGNDTLSVTNDTYGYWQLSRNKETANAGLGKVFFPTDRKESSSLRPWAGLYRRYFADADKIEKRGNGVSLEKQLYIVRGDSLVELSKTTPQIGDKVETRLIVTSDRDLDFVVIKDRRAACLEPADQTSERVVTGDICLLRETRDAATLFYIEHLPKGHHILSYEAYIDRKGLYLDGSASLQCLYAPQGTAHSRGGQIEVTDN